MKNIEKIINDLKDAGFYEIIDIAVTSDKKISKIIDVEPVKAKKIILAAKRATSFLNTAEKELSLDEFLIDVLNEQIVLILNDDSILKLKKPIIHLDGNKKIKLHSYKKKDTSCVLCGAKQYLINHHVSYKYDLTATVCVDDHRTIHKNKKHPLYQIDERQEVLIKLTRKNSNRLKRYCTKRNFSPTHFVNKILDEKFVGIYG